jgi:hypothetical protein
LPGDEVEFENEEEDNTGVQGLTLCSPVPANLSSPRKKVTYCKRKINCSDNKVDKAHNIMESLWQNKMNKESRD